MWTRRSRRNLERTLMAGGKPLFSPVGAGLPAIIWFSIPPTFGCVHTVGLMTHRSLSREVLDEAICQKENVKEIASSRPPQRPWGHRDPPIILGFLVTFGLPGKRNQGFEWNFFNVG